MRTIEIEDAGNVVKNFRGGKRRPGALRVVSKGKLVAFILPAGIYDEEDVGYMSDPGFWRMISERRKSTEFVSLDEMKAALEVREHDERPARKKPPAAKVAAGKWKMKQDGHG